MKCYEQHAIGGGSFVNGWFPAGIEVSDRPRHWAASEEEMSLVVAYSKATTNLKATVAAARSRQPNAAVTPGTGAAAHRTVAVVPEVLRVVTPSHQQKLYPFHQQMLLLVKHLMPFLY